MPLTKKDKGDIINVYVKAMTKTVTATNRTERETHAESFLRGAAVKTTSEPRTEQKSKCRRRSALKAKS